MHGILSSRKQNAAHNIYPCQKPWSLTVLSFLNQRLRAAFAIRRNAVVAILNNSFSSSVILAKSIMDYKTFTSQNGWFSLTLPADWEEYGHEDDTYVFCNAKTLTGNFRITPFRWTEQVDANEDKAAQYIAEQLRENEGAIKINLGDYECASYKEDLLQDDDKLLIYYWATGQKHNLFVRSFTINKIQENSKQNKIELDIVQNIIKSIVINDF
jgi:hypothetical protein